ncbi:uncharacterized protein STEHIDRAFT_57025 [Stereum hirsutum FP-91666 SS1]|uniref:uncharacterized protein n=1 Tax=Stereum hirsutum (strain FP-91666) TaxID=721885 RepID=UPI000440EFD4|nr:uncharacterized protein STEHIDRAFT_57025 [Stereum hirsutum FP-91666 SS1]EIM86460.1 hypothetical protein STEHIDRAFT_57025 [Stereum hirsutum FP-91666 SS1]
MDDLKQKRHDAIVRAGRAWMGGNVKNRGGEVAMFYAEQARELQEQVKKEALGAARDKVEGTRVTADNGTTVDLHGTIVSEAVTIAKEILAEHGATSARPLKFITGRGNHSVGRVGVLGPAVRSALVEDGWNVSTWDAGLVVRGRR